MKLAPAQRAAAVALIPCVIALLLYAAFDSNAETEYVIAAATWAHTSESMPGLVNAAAKIGLLALVVLIFYPLGLRAKRQEHSA